MRSASSRISTVSSRSGSPTLASSSWAAPRMPESGFLTSCARIAAMPETLRAALRKVSWRSSVRAAEASWNASRNRTRLLRQRRALHGDAVLVQARAFQSEVVVRHDHVALPHLGQQHEDRDCRAAPGPTACSWRAWAAEMPRNCSAAGLMKRKRSAASSSAHRRPSAPSISAAMSGRRGASRRPTTFSATADRIPHAASRPSSGIAMSAAAPYRASIGVPSPAVGSVRRLTMVARNSAEPGRPARVPGDVLAGQAQPGLGAEMVTAWRR